MKSHKIISIYLFLTIIFFFSMSNLTAQETRVPASASIDHIYKNGVKSGSVFGVSNYQQFDKVYYKTNNNIYPDTSMGEIYCKTIGLQALFPDSSTGWVASRTRDLETGLYRQIRQRFVGAAYLNTHSKEYKLLNPQIISGAGISISGNTISYDNIYNGADLRYAVNNERLKVELIISEQLRDNLSSPYPANLTRIVLVTEIDLEGKHAINLSDASPLFGEVANVDSVDIGIFDNDELHFKLPFGFAFQESERDNPNRAEFRMVHRYFRMNDKNYSLAGIPYELVKNTVDYPGAIVFDPSISWQHGPAAGKDTNIPELFPTLNYGLSTEFLIASSINQEWRSLIQFDSVYTIPTTANIDSAILSLYSVTSGSNPDGEGTEVKRLTTDWTEGVGVATTGVANWDSASTGVEWTSAGGDFNATFIDSTDTPINSVKWVYFDITTPVAGWVAGDYANYGLIIKSTTTPLSGGSVRFATSDNTSAGGQWRPILTVYFKLNNPLSSVYDLESNPSLLNTSDSIGIAFTDSNAFSTQTKYYIFDTDSGTGFRTDTVSVFNFDADGITRVDTLNTTHDGRSFFESAGDSSRIAIVYFDKTGADSTFSDTVLVNSFSERALKAPFNLADSTGLFQGTNSVAITWQDTNSANISANLVKYMIVNVDSPQWFRSDLTNLTNFSSAGITRTDTVDTTWDGSRMFQVNGDSANITVAYLQDYNKLINTDSLVAYFDLNDNSADSVGGNDGVDSFMVYDTTAFIDHGGSFDGTTSKINITDVYDNELTNTATGTISAWVKPFDATPNPSDILISFPTSVGVEFLLITIETAGTIKAALYDGGWAWTLEADNINFEDSTWTHIALTHDGIAAKWFVNSVFVAQTFDQQTTKSKWFVDLTSVDNARISSSFSNGTESGFFHGMIDEVSFYKRALSATEIKLLYDSYAHVPAAYFSLDGVVTDKRGNDGSATAVTYEEHANYGQAAVFDGSTSHINIDSVLTRELANTSVGTWAAWVKPTDATPAAESSIITFGKTTGGADQIRLTMTTAGKIDCQNYAGAGFKWFLSTSSAVFEDNTWTHIILTQDGTEPKLYVNGIFVLQAFSQLVDKTNWLKGTSAINNAHIGVLKSNSGVNRYWGGSIDEVVFLKDNVSVEGADSLYRNSVLFHDLEYEYNPLYSDTTLFSAGDVNNTFVYFAQSDSFTNYGNSSKSYIPARSDTSAHLLFWFGSNPTDTEYSVRDTVRNIKGLDSYIDSTGSVWNTSPVYGDSAYWRSTTGINVKALIPRQTYKFIIEAKEQ